MDMSKKEIENRGIRILDEMNKLNGPIDKKRQTNANKIEMRRRLLDCEGSVRSLIFDLIRE